MVKWLEALSYDAESSEFDSPTNQTEKFSVLLAVLGYCKTLIFNGT